MSDTADMLRFIEHYPDMSANVRCGPWDVIEVIDDRQQLIAWVGPMVQKEGHC